MSEPVVSEPAASGAPEAADALGGNGESGGNGGNGGNAARRRPGRRPGSADTRGQILAAAREIFAEKGFDKATVRGIARQAGVDPALVHHYFAGKEGIFVAAMELPINPENVVAAILAGPRDEVGERLTRLILTITSDAAARQPLLALVRTAMTNDQMVVMIREFMTRALLHRVAELLQIPPLRMEAAFAQLFGVVLVRYVLKLEPLASTDVEDLVELLAPTIQRYLDPARP
ncbi:TetR family transcriptional regulator [Streptosporangium sp. NPDC050855]|uniref:TetR/AcrR family transcriptional regulator n=1 Tax=Streptosporangium sp. NPDC050855 TaxID=3366194 RepID=UPI0037A3BA9E